jgi:hypothetical protein
MLVNGVFSIFLVNDVLNVINYLLIRFILNGFILIPSLL